jgi:hypothetical protein
MFKGFELGAALFLPLAQLTGPELFHTAVPNLNPRLEMWLLSIGSGGIRTSPPLPSNIFPEVVQTNNDDKNKKVGLFDWISGRSKWTALTKEPKTASHTIGNSPSVASRTKPQQKFQALMSSIVRSNRSETIDSPKIKNESKYDGDSYPNPVLKRSASDGSHMDIVGHGKKVVFVRFPPY